MSSAQEGKKFVFPFIDVSDLMYIYLIVVCCFYIYSFPKICYYTNKGPGFDLKNLSLDYRELGNKIIHIALVEIRLITNYGRNIWTSKSVINHGKYCNSTSVSFYLSTRYKDEWVT